MQSVHLCNEKYNGNSINSANVPQCHSFDRGSADRKSFSSIGESNSGDCWNSNQLELALNASSNEYSCLNALPDEILFQVLLNCGPTVVEESVKLVCHRLHNATSLSPELWKEFCKITGKRLNKCFADTGSLTDFDSPSNPLIAFKETSKCTVPASVNLYRQYYFRNPCVPIDFATISEALEYCPSTPSRSMLNLCDETSFYSNIGTVVLMPGVYRERIHIDGTMWSSGQTLRAIAIRAAFPDVGAALMHYHSSPLRGESWHFGETPVHGKDQPCISILTRDESGLPDVHSFISVKISHLRILHSTPGADIWGGNTAICVDGPHTQVIIDSCVLQSDSGRGLVVTNKAELQMTRTNISDCAATGFYLGDYGSRANITSCNIVRNGFGSRRLRMPADNDGVREMEIIRNQLAFHGSLGRPMRRDQFAVVPPGHSGVYIESSMAWVEDSLLAGNSLTGLSVVRGGFVSLSGCDVTENGHIGADPVMIEDAHDVLDRDMLGGIVIRGGVLEGPLPNNFSSLKKSETNIFKGGRIRKATFINCMNEPMTEMGLLRAYEGTKGICDGI